MDEDDKYVVLPFFWIPEDNIDLRVKRDHELRPVVEAGIPANYGR
jgi:hypothetical protein